MKYKNAPIREAVLDIRVNSISKSAKHIIESHKELIDKYPESKKRVDFQGKIEIKDDKQTYAADEPSLSGYIFLTSDKSRQVQFRTNGFTYNMLKPYTDWSDFSSEAFRLWKIYKKDTNPDRITRIALRYINRIPLPLPLSTFEEYIKYMPPIPQCLPQSFRNFFLHMSVPYGQENIFVNITETLEKPGSDYLPFLLDIDVYEEGEFSLAMTSLKKKFEQLREAKNNIFEDCITDKSREIFN